MHKTFRVLIFPCGSEIGLELHRSLFFSKHFELFGASSVEDNGRFVYDNYVGELPFIGPQLYQPLLNVLDKYSIDLLIPAHDDAVMLFAKWAYEEKLNDTQLITAPYQTCFICRSKARTYAHFLNIINTPNVYRYKKSDYNFPLFLKPDVGQGSKGTALAQDESDLNFYTKKDSSLLICEYLPGSEYTIDCFTDRHNNLRFVGGRLRQRISGGISVNSVSVEDARFEDMANTIQHKLQLRGQWFFQVKERVNGDLVLMEIAPRCAGNSGHNRNRGVNLPLLSLFDRLNHDVTVDINPYNIETERSLKSRYRIDFEFDRVYIGFERTLLIGDTVNNKLLSILYCFKNKGLKLYMICEMYEDISSSIFKVLEKYAISSNLFDEIISIGKTEEKADHVKCKKSIFIDASFIDRSHVHRKCSIPVFDIDQAIDIFEQF